MMSSALLSGVPWWGYLIGGVAWLLAYICRQLVLLRLASKALDKADAKHIPAIMTVLYRGRGSAAADDPRPPVKPVK
ncbi:hypothetical protein [Nonomuraea glycinis]|uniref:hypothetical protein n=1 Tax=Nonomuraea glycinis TaxID=2047744 RepID=UPI0033B45275